MFLILNSIKELNNDYDTTNGNALVGHKREVELYTCYCFSFELGTDLFIVFKKVFIFLVRL